jgi:hypothetical protein
LFFEGAVVCVELSAAARAQDSRRARVRAALCLLLLERRWGLKLLVSEAQRASLLALLVQEYKI